MNGGLRLKVLWRLLKVTADIVYVKIIIEMVSASCIWLFTDITLMLPLECEGEVSSSVMNLVVQTVSLC